MMAMKKGPQIERVSLFEMKTVMKMEPRTERQWMKTTVMKKGPQIERVSLFEMKTAMKKEPRIETPWVKMWVGKTALLRRWKTR